MSATMHNTDGTLNVTGLACGYVETRKAPNGAEVTLGWESCCYYVGYWHETNRPYRRMFRTLAAARAYFRRVGNHSTPEGK